MRIENNINKIKSSEQIPLKQENKEIIAESQNNKSESDSVKIEGKKELPNLELQKEKLLSNNARLKLAYEGIKDLIKGGVLPAAALTAFAFDQSVVSVGLTALSVVGSTTFANYLQRGFQQVRDSIKGTQGNYSNEHLDTTHRMDF